MSIAALKTDTRLLNMEQARSDPGFGQPRSEFEQLDLVCMTFELAEMATVTHATSVMSGFTPG